MLLWCSGQVNQRFLVLFQPRSLIFCLPGWVTLRVTSRKHIFHIDNIVSIRYIKLCNKNCILIEILPLIGGIHFTRQMSSLERTLACFSLAAYSSRICQQFFKYNFTIHERNEESSKLFWFLNKVVCQRSSSLKWIWNSLFSNFNALIQLFFPLQIIAEGFQ